MEECWPRDAYNGTPLIGFGMGMTFTLHAPSTSLMSHYTHWTMKRGDALQADCYRDIRLAKHWGFEPSKPNLVVPGSGGFARIFSTHPHSRWMSL